VVVKDCLPNRAGVGRRTADNGRQQKIDNRWVSLATHRCPSMESGNGWRAAKDGEHTILNDGWQITTSDHSVQVGGRRRAQRGAAND
jgi:hypothetical protein